MSTLTEIRTKVIGIVRDNTGKLIIPDDYDRNIEAAIVYYSKHKPDIKTVDIVGNGTAEYDLPADWNNEFSSIKSIEYPIGNIPASLIDEEDYEIYQTPTGKKIRFHNINPSESFRIIFTALRTTSTIPDIDVIAVSNLAAAFCLEELANAYAQTTDSTISADSVNYRTQTQDYTMRAKRLIQIYKEHMGIKEGDITTPASTIIDLDFKYPGGRDRLTHPRWERENR